MKNSKKGKQIHLLMLFHSRDPDNHNFDKFAKNDESNLGETMARLHFLQRLARESSRAERMKANSTGMENSPSKLKTKAHASISTFARPVSMPNPEIQKKW